MQTYAYFNSFVEYYMYSGRIAFKFCTVVKQKREIRKLKTTDNIS